jgi:hypothetical protein
MNINLKHLAQQKASLIYAQKQLSGAGRTSRYLKDLVRLLEEIEVDLEIGGESIVELDMPRLEAIEERNKFLAFSKESDEDHN